MIEPGDDYYELLEDKDSCGSCLNGVNQEEQSFLPKWVWKCLECGVIYEKKVPCYICKVPNSMGDFVSDGFKGSCCKNCKEKYFED